MIAPSSLTVGVTGAGGLVGRETCRLLRVQGHQVVPFSRNPKSFAGKEARSFSTDTKPDFSGIDAVIHLAGEPILGIWTAEKKRRIMDSRVFGTQRVVEGIADSGCVRTLICASAIGFYGSRGDEELTEDAPAGSGFLAQVCQAWEAEAQKAEQFGCRVCWVRIGFVLGHGGILRMVLPVFRLGLGARLGNGKQWVAPIHNEDLARIFLFLLEHEKLAGAFNACMPTPVTNAEFTNQIAAAAHRPAPFVVPAFALRLALGGLADLMLSSLRVVPRRLLQERFQFHYPTVLDAFADLFSKP